MCPPPPRRKRRGWTPANSPTEEEFTVAKRWGIPIWAFRKRGVTVDPAQEAFVRRIQAYQTGLFRKGFSSATELLPEVARAIREIEQRPVALTFSALSSPPEAPWKTFERRGWRSPAATLELIAMPIEEATPTATALSVMPARLARVGRDHGFFEEVHTLETGIEYLAAFAATRPDRNVPIAGIGVTANGAVCVWREMASDMLGVIVDQADPAPRIGRMLLIVAEFVPATSSVALAIGLHHLGSLSRATRRISAIETRHQCRASARTRTRWFGPGMRCKQQP